MDLGKLALVSNAFQLQLPKGIFLNTRHNGKDNVMTIGWGSIGVMWGKPSLTVMVRHSRYTNELLANSDIFTVSLPRTGDMAEALEICGRISGRTINKFEKAGLAKGDGRTVDAPIVIGCETQFECRILYRQSMEPTLLVPEIKARSYTNRDWHVFYIGEIVDCY